MKLTSFLLTCCLMLIPVPLLAGSDGIEQVASSADSGSEHDVLSSLHKALAPAKKFLSEEAHSLKGWIQKTLSAPSGRTTPRVMIELPPRVIKESPATLIAPEQPQEISAQDGAADQVAPPPTAQTERPENPAPEEQPIAQAVPVITAAAVPVLAEPAAALEDVAKQQPVRSPRIFQPGKPKPAPPVAVLETAKLETPKALVTALPPPLPVAAAPVKENVALVASDRLMLGQSMMLGSAFDGIDKNCINKQNGSVLFCIDPVIWPEDIHELFDSGAKLYRGTQAVVRYDGKKLSHAHALFLATRLKDVVAFFETRFGPPLETLQRIVTPFQGQPKNNPTVIWRKNETMGGKQVAVTLEVRGFDDTRGGFPDMAHGLVRLYGSDSLPIFPRVSVTEILLLKHALN